MSFRNNFLDFIPRVFPLVGQTNVLVAPFWDDSDVRVSGKVYYRFTDNQTLLEQIAANIGDAFSVNFNPVSAFVVTWSNISQYSGSVDVVSQ